jgi:hypothetical protein
LGGGGGGSTSCSSSVAGSGGSGTVILAVPNSAYPTFAPGARVTAAPPAYPGIVLLTYTNLPTASNTTPLTFTYTA